MSNPLDELTAEAEKNGEYPCPKDPLTDPAFTEELIRECTNEAVPSDWHLCRDGKRHHTTCGLFYGESCSCSSPSEDLPRTDSAMPVVVTPEGVVVRARVAEGVVVGLAWDDGRDPKMCMFQRVGSAYGHPLSRASILNAVDIDPAPRTEPAVPCVGCTMGGPTSKDEPCEVHGPRGESPTLLLATGVLKELDDRIGSLKCNVLDPHVEELANILEALLDHLRSVPSSSPAKPGGSDNKPGGSPSEGEPK